MKAHRTEATVSGDGSVTLHDLPFAEGEAIEVIVVERKLVDETDESLAAAASEKKSMTVIESGLAGLWKDRDLPDSLTYARQLREETQNRFSQEDLDWNRDSP